MLFLAIISGIVSVNRTRRDSRLDVTVQSRPRTLHGDHRVDQFEQTFLLHCQQLLAD